MKHKSIALLALSSALLLSGCNTDNRSQLVKAKSIERRK